MNKFVKVLLIFCLSLGLFFIQDSLVLASLDNDSDEFAACDITVGSVSLVPGTISEIYPIRNNGNISIYRMTVCGNALNEIHGDQDDTPINCMDAGDGNGPLGQELKVSIRIGFAGAVWKEFPLNASTSVPGCYTGEIEADPRNVGGTGENMDVELDNDDDNVCRKEMPVCRRVKAKFNFDITEDDLAGCQDFLAEQNQCNFLNISVGDRVDLGQSVTVSGVVDPMTQSEDCDLDGINEIGINVKNPQGNNVVDTDDYSAGDSFSETFTVDSLGVYTVKYVARGYYNYSYYSYYGGMTNITNDEAVVCERSFRVCNPGDVSCSSTTSGPSGVTEPYDICASNLQHNSTALQSCTTCMGNGGIWTSIGCIEQDPKSIVQKFITVGTGILGGIFLLRVLAAAFMLTTSQGDVKKTSEAKQMITEAIIGVIFVIFSVTILQFIGSDVMQIPGFGG